MISLPLLRQQRHHVTFNVAIITSLRLRRTNTVHYKHLWRSRLHKYHILRKPLFHTYHILIGVLNATATMMTLTTMMRLTKMIARTGTRSRTMASRVLNDTASTSAQETLRPMDVAEDVEDDMQARDEASVS